MNFRIVSVVQNVRLKEKKYRGINRVKKGKIEKCIIDYGYEYEVRIFELIGAVAESLEESRMKI